MSLKVTVNTPQTTIFFYDLECGVCNAIVDFLLTHSDPEKLSFVGLQTDFAKDLMEKHGVFDIDLSTAYLFDGKTIYKKSSALLRALDACTGPYKLLSFLKIFPIPVRDFCYDLFAKKRHLFSKNLKRKCRMLSKEEKKRFINYE